MSFTIFKTSAPKIPNQSIEPNFVLFPEHLGGGSFLINFSEEDKKTARNISQKLKTEIRGGSFQDTLSEVNHIISVSLGGTRDPENLNALKSSLNFMGKIKRLFGKDIDMGDLKNRQQGRVKVEREIANQVTRGEITREEGIVKLKGFLTTVFRRCWS